MNPHDPEPLAPFVMPPWRDIQTEGFLTENPLPADFQWPDRYGKSRAVLPTYRISGGYGKWLHETPYFPGLFELIHNLLARAPDDAGMDWLIARLDEHRPRGEQSAFF